MQQSLSKQAFAYQFKGWNLLWTLLFWAFSVVLGYLLITDWYGFSSLLACIVAIAFAVGLPVVWYQWCKSSVKGAQPK